MRALPPPKKVTPCSRRHQRSKHIKTLLLQLIKSFRVRPKNQHQAFCEEICGPLEVCFVQKCQKQAGNNAKKLAKICDTNLFPAAISPAPATWQTDATWPQPHVITFQELWGKSI